MASKNELNDWVAHQLRGLPKAGPGILGDRREERHRRRPPRRLDDSRYHSVDWHASHLLAVAISILLLSVCDACLTLALLEGGAREANPLMALLVGGDTTMFLSLKMAMTGVSVVLMVCLARYRFMRLVRVEFALYGILIAYLCLIGYEFWLFQAPGQSLPF